MESNRKREKGKEKKEDKMTRKGKEIWCFNSL